MSTDGLDLYYEAIEYRMLVVTKKTGDLICCPSDLSPSIFKLDLSVCMSCFCILLSQKTVKICTL